MYCGNCGAKLPDGAKFCTKCGAPVKNTNGDKKKKGLFVGTVVTVALAMLAVVLIVNFPHPGDRTSEQHPIPTTAGTSPQITGSVFTTATNQPVGMTATATVGTYPGTASPTYGTSAGSSTADKDKQVEKAWESYESICADVDEIEAPYLDADGFVTQEDEKEVLAKYADYAKELYRRGELSDYSYKDGDSAVYMQIDGWCGVLLDAPVRDIMSGSNDVSIITMEPYYGEFNFKVNRWLAKFHGTEETAKMLEKCMPDSLKLTHQYRLNEISISLLENIEFRNTILI